VARHNDIYKDKRWQRVRQYVIARDKGLCVECKKNGVLKPFKVIHHIIWLTDKNKYNWDIAFNPDNLECLCNECHERIHERKNETHLKDFINPVSR
jgi:5-methylcytosine-specific restriction endonuclease McrA